AGRLGVGGRVRFGRCDRADLALRYAAADAVVFAPLWEEPFGLVPLEAMACGTPVVASPTGGSAEFLVDGVNCVAFASGDAIALAEALERLAADVGLRRTIVDNGLRTAAGYDADHLAVELEAWHRSASER
ncbi:MAG: glycosyltransferase family 4 protein, partial [Acidimicrobiales bacterium]